MKLGVSQRNTIAVSRQLGTFVPEAEDRLGERGRRGELGESRQWKQEMVNLAHGNR